MSSLNPQGFEDFFTALWDVPPFAWQRELARRVLEDDTPWPEAIALPTSAGKTACLDVAVYALAVQAEREGKVRSAPRRMFFVVDRRVIVDEAYERARKLADKLRSAETGILRDVADRLRRLAGGDLPLACYQLRGGMYRSDAWAKSPLQPMIVASTVDQLGSRLLFRAYGRSFKAWPIQAGLAGNDALILLDEAHCSQPFFETLNAVRQYRAWAKMPLPSPFHVVVMSATPPAGIADVLCDDSDEPKNPEHPLGRRQLASKWTILRKVEKARGKSAPKDLANSLAEQAEQLSRNWTARCAAETAEHEETTGAPATVVFCNRVDTARKVHALLAARHNAVLLTGRMRPIDKDDTVKVALDQLSAGVSAQRRLDAPLFVVATQTLEVGANLDFDLLVTECASLDALRQRFGRLNRMGRRIPARAAILIRSDQAESSEDDPVYGEAICRTWLWLNEVVAQAGEIDMGIAALQPHLPEDSSLLNAPAPHAPVLLPAHVDAFAQTAPEPWPTPDVSLFLHGPVSGQADVQVCWRADLVGNDDDAWKEAVILCPPAAPECLAVPFRAMTRWLAGKSADAGSDVEGLEVIEAADQDYGLKRRVVRWRGREEVEVVDGASSLRPGDVLVVPAHLAGWEALATLGDDPVADWGDRAFAQARDKGILRLHPEVLKQWGASDLAPLVELAAHGRDRLDDDPDGLRDDIREALELLTEMEGPRELAWLPPVAKILARDFTVNPHPTGGLVLRGRLRLKQNMADADTFSDEDDTSASGSTHSLLEEHLDGVSKLAARFAAGSGLSADLTKVVEQAGLGHDLGKADPRFQAWLQNGNPWLRGPLLAKSAKMVQGPKESEAARKRAGYPKHGRHELLSVRLVESCPAALPEDEGLRDLLFHLIESHHGQCRPFAPVVMDDEPVDVVFRLKEDEFSASSSTGMARLDAGVAERFWRLTRRYGWWGLAWLETILRLADHRRSEYEESGDK